MKKLLSVFIAVLIIAAPLMSVCADETAYPDLFSGSNMLNGEVSVNFSLSVNKPFSPELGIDSSQIEDFSISAAGKFDYSEDMAKIKMDLTLDIDVGGERIALQAWYDIDASNPEAPKMKIIMKAPYEDKYMYMDYAALMSNQGMNVSDFLTGSPDFIGLQNDIESQISSSEIKKEVIDGVYTVKIPQSTILSVYKTMAASMSDIMKSYFVVSVDPFAPANEDYSALIDEFFAKLENIKLFAEDAVVVKATGDENNNVKTLDIAVNIQTNIAEIMEAFDSSSPGITKENSDIDVTLNINYIFDKINEGVVIEFPVLTPENSIDMFAGMPVPDPVSSEPLVFVFVNGEVLQSDVMPVIINDRTMIPVRAFFNAMGISDESISFSDGVVNIFDGSNSLQFTVGGSTAYINGAEISLDVPAQIVNDRTLVPARFFAEGLGLTVEWHEFSGDTSGGIVNIYGAIK
jgi:hypothetical protein